MGIIVIQISALCGINHTLALSVTFSLHARQPRGKGQHPSWPPGTSTRSFSPNPHYRRASTMSRRGNAAAALQDSTRGETLFREFARSNLTPEQSKQRAAVLLDSRDLLQNVQGLGPEDQTRFIDKVNQVRRSWSIRLSQCTSLILLTTGIPGHRLANCEIRN